MARSDQRFAAEAVSAFLLFAERDAQLRRITASGEVVEHEGADVAPVGRIQGELFAVVAAVSKLVGEGIEKPFEGLFVRCPAVESSRLRVASPAELVGAIRRHTKPDADIRPGGKDKWAERRRGHSSIGSPSLRAASAMRPRSPS